MKRDREKAIAFHFHFHLVTFIVIAEWRRAIVTGFEAENGAIISAAVLEVCIQRQHWFISAGGMSHHLHLASICTKYPHPNEMVELSMF